MGLKIINHGDHVKICKGQNIMKSRELALLFKLNPKSGEYETKD